MSGWYLVWYDVCRSYIVAIDLIHNLSRTDHELESTAIAIKSTLPQYCIHKKCLLHHDFYKNFHETKIFANSDDLRWRVKNKKLINSDVFGKKKHVESAFLMCYKRMVRITQDTMLMEKQIRNGSCLWRQSTATLARAWKKIQRVSVHAINLRHTPNDNE